MTSDWFAEAEERRREFLSDEIKGDFSLEPMAHDMAPRFYHRIHTVNKTMILLESAPDGHRQALPGHELGAFMKVAAFLRGQGFRVPEIYASSEYLGFILLEDFGNLTFETALDEATETDVRELYMRATQLLMKLKRIGSNKLFEFPVFWGSRLDNGIGRFTDWFLPYLFGRPVTDGEKAAFNDMLIDAKSVLPAIEPGFVHGDFHPSNLMILQNGELGLLDFQAAMRGPSIYDLANLLHDARRNVPKDIIWDCQNLYFEDEEGDLSDWYNFLSLHFHLRVIGQFIKVAIMTGKTSYLSHLDRLWGYLGESRISAFQSYAEQANIDFSKALPPLDMEKIKTYIRPDAA